MREVTLTAVVDETHVLHLELPPEIFGEVEAVVREKAAKGSTAALLAAIQSLPPRTEEDARFWRAPREELFRDRED